MDVVHPRCAGVDVSKRDAKVCVRIADTGRAKAKSTVTTWGSVTNQVLALRDHLVAEQVSLVVMEATSDYWKPFYSAPRGALTYPLRSREGLEVTSLGPMVYPDLKGKGENSMPLNRLSCPGVRGEETADPRDMAKA